MNSQMPNCDYARVHCNYSKNCQCSHFYNTRLIFKDDALCQLGAVKREVDELRADRDLAQSRLAHLQKNLQDYQEGMHRAYRFIIAPATRTNVASACA